MDKLLSIIIATKGREYYCVKTIEAILPLLNNNTEIVISDNSDSDYISDALSNINDNRIVYKHTKDVITMSENYNIGIEASCGRYLCMIGDDDGILSNIYKALNFAIDNDIDVITQDIVVNYVWPDKGGNNGTLYLTDFNDGYVEIDAKKALVAYLKQGCAKNPRDLDLPALYHGLVKRESLLQLKAQTGEYILGVSSDSYTSVALACIINKQVRVQYPFTIGGACKDSWSAQNMRKSYCGPIESNPQYALTNKKNGYHWHPAMPRYYSAQTIWAESSLQALSILKKDELINDYFSLKNLTIDALIDNRTITGLILKETKNLLNRNKKNSFTFFICVFLCVLLGFIRKIKGKIFKTKPLYNTIENNMGEIDVIIERLSKDSKYTFK